MQSLLRGGTLQFYRLIYSLILPWFSLLSLPGTDGYDCFSISK